MDNKAQHTRSALQPTRKSSDGSEIPATVRRLIPLLLLSFLPLTISLQSACSRFPNRVILSVDESNNVDTPRVWAFRDSVRLILQMNDTLFSIDEYEHHRRLNELRESSFGRRGEIIDTTRIPRLSIYMESRAGQNLLVPGRPSVYPSCLSAVAQCYVYLGQSGQDKCLPPPFVIGDDFIWGVEPDYYRLLRPGERLLVAYRVSVFDMFDIAEIPANRYWVLSSLFTSLWQDTLPPPWIGGAISDTLWFRME